MKINTLYMEYDGVQLQVGRYADDGSLAVQAWNPTEGPIATITKCLCDSSLADDESYVDTNNCPWAMGWLENEKLAVRTHKTRMSGFCEYPLMKFDMRKLGEIASAM